MSNDIKSKIRLFMDSGAPTFYGKYSSKLKPSGGGTHFANRKYDRFDYVYSEEFQQYTQDYIDFLKKEAKDLFVYVNLDVINNAELTWQQQLLLEQNGLSPMPVFHISSDEKYLRRYVDNYDYIAIAGMGGNSRKNVFPMLDHLFKKYIMDDKGKPRVKVHGLAATSLPLMQRYPWYSVDSSTCHKLAIYGNILIPDVAFTNFHILTISNRNPHVLQTISPEVLKRILSLSEMYNCPLEELMSDFKMGALWNYLVFLDVLYSTRDKFARGYIMDFYYAGVLTEEFEIKFWNRVAASDTFKHFNLTRLFSYMYKDIYLNFKKNETSIIR